MERPTIKSVTIDRRTRPRTPVARPTAQPPLNRPAPTPQASSSAMECWRVERVAKLLDVSKKRIYNLVRERRLEAIRVGPRQMRIPKRSIEQFLGRLVEEEKVRDY